MGLLARLFGRDNTPQKTLPEGGRVVLEGPDTFELAVVGESFHQDALERICAPRTDESQDRLVEAHLVLENDNPHDSMAVRVDISELAVGYLSRAHARQYREQIRKAGYATANAYCRARIRGGWDRGEGDRGFYGVYLDVFVNP
jgi:hypothetical protein